MDRQVTKAVIPVAGWGTRLLPATKSQPKEMLPVGRKPGVQYIVEEMADCHVNQILFVTGAKKTSIEDHFDYDEELVRRLREGGKEDLLGQVLFGHLNMRIHYTRQPMQLGLGDAIGYGEQFTGGDPFVVALGDSIVTSGHDQRPALARMIDAFEQTNCDGIIAFETVDRAHVSNYGIARVAADCNPQQPFQLLDLIEKPKPSETPSTFAIAGRYIFTAAIYDALRRIQPGYGQELQLTDAIRLLIKEGARIQGLLMTNGEQRFDIGNYESYWKAFMHFALRDPEVGSSLREYLIGQCDLIDKAD